MDNLKLLEALSPNDVLTSMQSLEVKGGGDDSDWIIIDDTSMG